MDVFSAGIELEGNGLRSLVGGAAGEVSWRETELDESDTGVELEGEDG